MTRLVNSFSYSHSRGELFRECPRRYWFARYGGWGGWERTADPVTREIYRLTKLSNRYLWTGHHVHDRVEGLIARIAEKVPLPPEKEERTALLETLRREYAHSKKDRSGHNPPRKGFWGLLEHEGRDFAIPDADWKPLVERAGEALGGFYRSWVLSELFSADPVEILDRDAELRTLTLDVDGREVPVYMKIDLAYRLPDGTVRVVDWKTGRPGPPDEHEGQLALYAWYYAKERGIPLDRIRLGPVYLAHRPERVELQPVLPDTVDRVLGETLDTIREILALVDDPNLGVARKERFPVTVRSFHCRDCPFRPFCPDRPRPSGSRGDGMVPIPSPF